MKWFLLLLIYMARVNIYSTNTSDLTSIEGLVAENVMTIVNCLLLAPPYSIVYIIARLSGSSFSSLGHMIPT